MVNKNIYRNVIDGDLISRCRRRRCHGILYVFTSNKISSNVLKKFVPYFLQLFLSQNQIFNSNRNMTIYWQHLLFS